MKIKQYTRPVLAAVLAATVLSGCVGALVGGAAVGTKSAIDRRTTGAQTDDNVMALRVEQTALSYLRQNNQTAGYTPKLNVVSYNRRLLLLGQVSSEGEKQFVGQIARSEQAAEGVYNYITVASPARSINDVVADTWGTSKVRTSLLGVSAATQARTKIVTYDNITYVMGILTPEEQALVTQKVSTTLGVQKVITLFQNYTPQ
ncbi:BON domain-containing protein [Neisseria sp. ZJ106]|uniref:BON domain-containing protein n=1 Tax=Neisseria lisongii TaxID=2912188 RepID=A0AAW5AIV3_9NEIS|nr:BON domain-containing protein [Neisseria lisongii]MCF7521895.1 BON domain-containing protein [Neisseria lisongii]MCF7529084.1 BON domain-containing protein [Neisseria lisongii]WCL71143.1 BON domain-containing protein [Neisseria lisongii]